jgi:hypothetical protein
LDGGFRVNRFDGFREAFESVNAGSAWAKNALAKRSISLAWRSSFTSRSKDLMRSRS